MKGATNMLVDSNKFKVMDGFNAENFETHGCESTLVEKYQPMQRFFHWISAVVILWATITGFSVALGIFSSEYKNIIGNFNVALTLAFIPFFIIRVFTCICMGKPKDSRFSKKQTKLIFLAHFFIYTSISVVLMSGLLMMERNINLLGCYTFKPILEVGYYTALSLEVHRYSCAVLASFILVHIFAVIYHHSKGVNVINKMT